VLYLFDPVGGRYRLYRWSVTKNAPFLAGWSGDKTRDQAEGGSDVVPGVPSFAGGTDVVGGMLSGSEC